MHWRVQPTASIAQNWFLACGLLGIKSARAPAPGPKALQLAYVVELADTLVLGTSVLAACRFESCRRHPATMVELVYTAGLNPAAPGLTGSNPVGGIGGKVTVRSFQHDNQKKALEVMQCAADGLSLKDTAKRLNYTENSVKVYRRMAVTIMDSRDMTQAVAEAMRRGYIK